MFELETSFSPILSDDDGPWEPGDDEEMEVEDSEDESEDDEDMDDDDDSSDDEDGDWN